IGSCGFIALIALLFSRRPMAGRNPLLGALVLLNLAAILLATVGGFGTLLSFVLSPLIRGYCRISVFVGFFSLFAVVLFVDWFAGRFAVTGRAHKVFACGLALLVAAGVFDQTPDRLLPDYRAWKDYYRRDADYVRGVEDSLPAGAMV